MWEVVSAVWVWRQSEKPWSSSNMQATLQQGRAAENSGWRHAMCKHLNSGLPCDVGCL